MTGDRQGMLIAYLKREILFLHILLKHFLADEIILWSVIIHDWTSYSLVSVQWSVSMALV